MHSVTLLTFQYHLPQFDSWTVWGVFYCKTKPPLWWFLFSLKFLVFENQQRRSLLGEKSSASEQSAKDFSMEETKFLKRKSVGTFNASAAKQRICVRIELAEAGVAKQLISAKRNSDSENIEFGRTAGS